MVPLVSAEDIHFVRDLSNVQKEKKIAQPLNESEMITILFSNGWLEKQNTGETKGIVNLTVNESKFKEEFILDKTHLNRFVDKNLKPKDNVVIFRMPRTMFQRLNQDPNGLNISLPESHFFRAFDNIDKINSILEGKELAPLELMDTQQIPNQNGNNKNIALSNEPNNGWHIERVFFVPNAGFSTTHYLIGEIVPAYRNFQGSDHFHCYQERELSLGGGDYIEIGISYDDVQNGSRILLEPNIVDNGIQKDYSQYESQGSGSISISPSSLPHYFGYHVQLTNSRYYITFEDMNTLSWYPQYAYHDQDAGIFINSWTGSSELNLHQNNVPIVQYHAWTTAYDEWNQGILGDWQRPRAIWHFDRFSDNSNFVGIGYCYVNSGGGTYDIFGTGSSFDIG